MGMYKRFILAKAITAGFALSHTAMGCFVVCLSVTEMIQSVQEERHFSSEGEVQIWLTAVWPVCVGIIVKHLAWDVGDFADGYPGSVSLQTPLPFWGVEVGTWYCKMPFWGHVGWIWWHMGLGKCASSAAWFPRNHPLHLCKAMRDLALGRQGFGAKHRIVPTCQ